MARIVLVAWLVLVPAVALADVIPPDVASCETRSEGDPCTLSGGGNGSCQMGEKCRLNYACDGGTGGPCGTFCSPALVCKECKNCESGCSLAPAAGAPPVGLPGFLALGLLLTLGLLRRR